MNATSLPCKGKTPFVLHLLSPSGVKETVRIEAHNPDDLRLEVRKTLPGYQIQKVKRDRTGGANGTSS